MLRAEVLDGPIVQGFKMDSNTNILPSSLPNVPANSNKAYLIPVNPMNTSAFTSADIAQNYANYCLRHCSVELIGLNSTSSVGYQFVGFVQTADVSQYETDFPVSSLESFGQCTMTSLFDKTVLKYNIANLGSNYIVSSD